MTDPKSPEDAEPGDWILRNTERTPPVTVVNYTTYYKDRPKPKMPWRNRLRWWLQDLRWAWWQSGKSDASMRELLRNKRDLQDEMAKQLQREFWFGRRDA